MLLDHGLAGRWRDRRPAAAPARRRACSPRASRRSAACGSATKSATRSGSITSSPRSTRIRFVTEGVLLRQMLADPELARRQRDRLRRISRAASLRRHHARPRARLQETTRPDLKLVVMSATLDAGALEKYLAPCEVLTSSGRTFPVEIEYLDQAARRHARSGTLAARGTSSGSRARPKATCSIFMPGAYEISRTIRRSRDARRRRVASCCRCTANCRRASRTPPSRSTTGARSIVSTNVAETSLTIDGVRVVIDSGLARIARFDPYRGINTLLVEKISRAVRRPARRPRRPHRAGPLPAALDASASTTTAPRRNCRK